YARQPAWWVRFDQFQQGIGALGGGNVTLQAGGKVENLSASTPTQARMQATSPDATRLVKTGGGDVRVEAGGDLLGGQYYADRGDLVLKVGGKMDSGQDVSGNPLYAILALGDAQARVQVQGDVNIQTILNPHLVVQSSGNSAAFNINNITSPSWSLFSTYGAESGVDMQSLDGKVTLHNGGEGSAGIQEAYRKTQGVNGPGLNFNISSSNYKPTLLSLLPPTLSATAFQNDIFMNDGDTDIVLSPSAHAQLTLLAANSISIPARIVLSDRDPALIPNAIRPGTEYAQFPTTLLRAQDLVRVHAAVPIHTGDTQPVRVYAVAGDIRGNEVGLPNLDVAKAVQVRAGQDVRDLGILVQHANAGDLSQVVAGRDVAFISGNSRTDDAKIWVGGLGRLEVTAGRNIDLGTSAGIVSRGDLDNAQLPTGGADIHVAAGVGPTGIDYAGAVGRLVAELEKAGGNPTDALLWQARWLVRNDALNGASALQAVKAVQALDMDAQREMVREMVYSALLVTGRDSNNRSSPFAANFERGYAALELVFPGLREQNEDGSFKNYQGEINLFASRIKTERGGNIEFMVPGGDLIVGLSNTPAVLVNTGNDVLGMLTVADGNVRGFARDNILVNQSRILTVGGGNVLLWSSEGDIDAGKGKKTATAVPPPIIKVDQEGKVTQELQGAASGSGIGALSSGGRVAGDIDLIAPKGTVNAGDAGIRANNLNIAAQVVLGADNIAVAGTTTGAPVADASAVSATTSGATSQGDDVGKATAALSQNLSDAARTSDAMKKLKPTFISAEVIGHGE
ncbi:MAG: filamentous hemagglutinin family protein, partial [Nitrosospira sp.]